MSGMEPIAVAPDFPSTWWATSIPCRIVERVYGSGNFDDAGDDLIDASRLVSDYPNQFRHRFNFDTSHPNPWYHAMIFEIEGIRLRAICRASRGSRFPSRSS
ncbi:hypothetical protein FACS189475_03610 [Betaproteobacteria bacterium]|nr:hypothetical protein FACS189475_03610 [Betaproteobacteria bacterium]